MKNTKNKTGGHIIFWLVPNKRALKAAMVQTTQELKVSILLYDKDSEEGD